MIKVFLTHCMTEDQKQILTIGIVGLVILGGLLMLNKNRQTPAPQEEGQTEEPSTMEAVMEVEEAEVMEEQQQPTLRRYNKQPVADEAPEPVPTVPVKDADPMPYQEVVDSFDGRRFEVTNCRLHPFRGIFKSGTTIMLDGRTPGLIQTVHVGNQKVVLGPLGVGYVTLSNPVEIPLTLSVDCEANGKPNFNIGEIVIAP